MTREEEINEAIETYMNGLFEDGVEIPIEDYENIEDGFSAGAKWADEHPKNIWHDATEEPQQDRLMLGIDCEGSSIYKWIGQDPNGWYSFIKETGLSKWAYISDLSKGGEK